MKKQFTKWYLILAAFMVGILFFIRFSFQIDRIENRTEPKYTVLDELSIKEVNRPKSEGGTHIDYTMQLPSQIQGREHLIFYLVHQEVKVYVDNKLVYQMHDSVKNQFGRTPGCTWNSVPLYSEDAGKELRIEITSPYEATLHPQPTFYMGDKYSILTDCFAKDLGAIGIGLLTMIVGVAFILFIALVRKYSAIDKNLLNLGMFAIALGAWEMFDTAAMGMLLPRPELNYIPYMMLMMFPIPFVSFVRNLQTSKEDFVWKFILGVCVVDIIVCNGLQLLNLYDLRETLWITHVTFIVVLTLGIYEVIRDTISEGMTPKMKLNLVCLSFCVVGTVLDLINYYVHKGYVNMLFGLLGFLLYIIALGIVSIIEAKRLMDIVREAKKYENLAYHDELTGMYNRLAWKKMMRTDKADCHTGTVIMMDLNDLKKYNDSRGHECGDRYLTESAKLIEQVFGTKGSCFRMGGDEFCVLFLRETSRTVEELVLEFKEQMDNYNNSQNEFSMKIAYGVERFDSELDLDLDDTKNRADTSMYRRKAEMKSQGN